MSVDRRLLVPLVVTIVFTGAFVVNEWTGGSLGDLLGLAGNHMLATTACGPRAYESGFAIPCPVNGTMTEAHGR